MNFNLRLEKLNKKNYQSKRYGKILTVRLPCNPIFPIGPIYLADHIHKCFPDILFKFESRIGKNRIGLRRNFRSRFKSVPMCWICEVTYM